MIYVLSIRQDIETQKLDVFRAGCEKIYCAQSIFELISGNSMVDTLGSLEQDSLQSSGPKR